MSIHFESYITKRFIGIGKLEPIRMKDENSIICASCKTKFGHVELSQRKPYQSS